MSKYHVWVNCAGFKRLVVEANNPEEAEKLATNHFQCDDGSPGDIDHGETRIATEEDVQTAEDWS